MSAITRPRLTLWRNAERFLQPTLRCRAEKEEGRGHFFLSMNAWLVEGIPACPHHLPWKGRRSIPGPSRSGAQASSSSRGGRQDKEGQEAGQGSAELGRWQSKIPFCVLLCVYIHRFIHMQTDSCASAGAVELTPCACMHLALTETCKY